MLALVTRADSTISEMTEITHPIMREYAKKIGADFIVLDDDKGLHHHYRILQFYKLFDKYDRIISMDSDIIITPDCPNLFEVVPEEKIGTVYEDIFSRRDDRRMRMYKAQKQFGEIHWVGGYVNSGCMVFSKCHKELFKQRELYMDLGYDDVYLGYWMVKLNLPVYVMSLKFNYMRPFAEIEDRRLEAYIIHYAGQGFTGNRLGDLKRDYLYFYGDPPYPQLKNQAIINEIPQDVESIADIGCGEGFLTSWLIKHSRAKIYPIDIENNNRMNFKVYIGDLTEETFPIKEVDVSIASEVLEHIRFWKDALKTLLNITKKKIIITVPYGDSFWEKGHLNFWDDTNIREFLILTDGWNAEIKKILTKEEDIKNNQLLFLICLTKLTDAGVNIMENSIKLTFPISMKQQKQVI